MKIYVLVPETEMKKILANVNMSDLRQPNLEDNLKNLNTTLGNAMFTNVIHRTKLMENPHQLSLANTQPAPLINLPAASSTARSHTPAPTSLTSINNKTSNNETPNKVEVNDERASSADEKFDSELQNTTRTSSTSESGSEFLDSVMSPNTSTSSLGMNQKKFLGKTFHWLGKTHKEMANNLLNILVQSEAVKIEKGTVISLLSKHSCELSSFIRPLYRKNGNITSYEEFLNVICQFIPLDLITNEKVKKIIKNGNSTGAGDIPRGLKFFLEKWVSVF